MIDITGLDGDLIVSFFRSRYEGESTIEERMASSSPDAIDPFEAIAGARQALTKAAQALAKAKPGLSSGDLTLELSSIIERSD